MNSQFEPDHDKNTEDAEQLGKAGTLGKDPTKEDTEGHRQRLGHGALESDEDDVEGHRQRLGHGALESDEDDVEGHRQRHPGA
jgi:hypothetical protein